MAHSMKSPAPILAACAAALALTACATPAPTFYGPATAPGGVGWSEFQIEPGRYRVTFRGGPGAPFEQVADYALLRAADLTLAQGYDWFRIADRAVQQVSRGSGPQLSLGTGTGSYGRRGGVSLGVGTTFDLGAGTALAQSLEIVMGRGPTPGEGGAYDAREVRKNLGPRAGEHA